MTKHILISVLCLGITSIISVKTQDNPIRTNDIDVDVDPSDPLVPLLSDIIGERYRLLQLLIQSSKNEPLLSYSPYDIEDDVPQSSDAFQSEGDMPAIDVVRQPLIRRVFKRLEPEVQILVRMAIMRKLQEEAHTRQPLHLGESIGMRFKKAREDILGEMRSPSGKFSSDEDSEKTEIQKRLPALSEDVKEAVLSAVLDKLRNSRKSVELQGMRGGR
ncbi:uncharacterized protein [Amphiura filiformis]|uniref:uncharacterized protein n=1 Tax=Amphiura filiformis TaxID=82378 RepID=UPI003B2167D9